MRNIFTFEYIEKIEIIRRYKELFNKFSGLELEILKPSSPIQFSCPMKKKSHSCEYMTENCNRIDQDVINHTVSFKMPQSFSCPFGLKKIVIPLFLDEEVVGILFTGENCSFRFNGVQIQALSDLLFQVTNYIIKNELNSLNNFRRNSLTHQQELLNKAIRYIRENYYRSHLTLKEVSGNNGIGYHYLSRLFKKELNTTFTQYRNKVRMEASTKLLKDRRLTISQIAYACGFDDPGYFCKVFKTTIGCSPINFRRKKFFKSRCR